MNTILENEYITEKQAFMKMIIDSRMLEITYSETFSLIFYKYINSLEGSGYKWITKKMKLVIDAPFWVGERKKWDEYVKENNGIMAMDDSTLAYELVAIRCDNLVRVQQVEFCETYLCITLDEERVLSIAYCSESDYSWILEECSNESQQEKTAIFCQGNEIFAINVPDEV